MIANTNHHPSAAISKAGRRAWSWLHDHGPGRWVALAGSVGLLCGVAGFVFNLGVNTVSYLFLGLIVGYQPGIHHATALPTPPGVAFVPWLIPLVVALGAALAGLVLSRLTSDAAGGGTGKAVSAYHNQRGIITMRLTLTKMLASMITIGCGGSAGREGPIALVGAGFGSWFAQRLKLTVRDRRVLVAAGLAGGVSAIFHAPLAAALFAAEVLYRGPDLEAEVILPGFIASITGFTCCGLLDDAWATAWGHEASLTSALFSLPVGIAFALKDWEQLAGYSVVALVIAMASRMYIACMKQAERRLGNLQRPLWFRVGIGGFMTGVIALGSYLLATITPGVGDPRMALSILGPGYGILQKVMDTSATEHLGMAMGALLAFVGLAKILTTSATIGSGGSGGMFGPSIVIGGCLGGATGIALQGSPIAPPPIAAMVMGMAGCLAATHRTPIAAILMVSEITGSYGLLIPSMWVCGVAFMSMGQKTLIVQQVSSPSESPAHRGHYLRELLAGTTIAGALVNGHACVQLQMATSLQQCRKLVEGSTQTVFPVVGQNERFEGIVTIDDLRDVLKDHDLDDLVLVADLVAGGAVALRQSEDLSVALRAFNRHELDELPMVDGHGRFVGLLGRSALIAYYQQAVDRISQEDS